MTDAHRTPPDSSGLAARTPDILAAQDRDAQCRATQAHNTHDCGLLNLRWAQALADGLAAAGVRDLVLSPGARSTPLALAFLRQPAIRCHVILDERSAAFFALGLARAGKHPPALLCTSGSAPANWFPAVVEAGADDVSLILLSADRPPELQGWGANQTVDQTRLFGSHVRAFHAPGAPCADFAPTFLHRLAARVVSESRGPQAGPVHVNLAFREPLLPAADPADWPLASKLPALDITVPQLVPDAASIEQIAATLSGRCGVIVCGGNTAREGRGETGGFAEAVNALAARLDCPIFAEPLSGLRFGRPADTHGRDRLCVRYEAFLRHPDFLDDKRPDWVLRFGAFPVTRAVQYWLASHATAQHIVIAPAGRWPDPQHRATQLLQADPLAVCQALLASALAAAPPAWAAAFARAEAVTAATAAPYLERENFEGALIAALIAQLPARHRLFCGNSMAIRDLDAFSGSGEKALAIFGNRGASGIDGNLSTALGIAVDGPCVALLGDLTAQHDLTALASARGRNIVCVVLNNGGGGIFDYLPQAALPEFEQAWLTPQGIDFSAAARAFGVAYTHAATLDDFRAALAAALARGGPTLLEVAIDRATSVTLHRAYWRDAGTAVAAAADALAVPTRGFLRT